MALSETLMRRVDERSCQRLLLVRTKSLLCAWAAAARGEARPGVSYPSKATSAPGETLPFVLFLTAA